MSEDLRRQMDKEMLEVIKIIPAMNTKIEEMHKILIGNGKDGLVEEFQNHIKKDIYRYAFAGGIGAGITLILKILKIL